MRVIIVCIGSYETQLRPMELQPSMYPTQPPDAASMLVVLCTVVMNMVDYAHGLGFTYGTNIIFCEAPNFLSIINISLLILSILLTFMILYMYSDLTGHSLNK